LIASASAVQAIASAEPSPAGSSLRATRLDVDIDAARRRYQRLVVGACRKDRDAAAIRTAKEISDEAGGAHDVVESGHRLIGRNRLEIGPMRVLGCEARLDLGRKHSGGEKYGSEVHGWSPLGAKIGEAERRPAALPDDSGRRWVFSHFWPRPSFCA
jgi:hypothetical protein